MRYDFSKMGSEAFELMIRSLYQSKLGIKCQQFGMGADGQREWVYEGRIKLNDEENFNGKTIGQVKYKYDQTKEKDYEWLEKNLKAELELFKSKESEYIPDNYIFCTNVVLTPTKDTGVHDRIYKFAEDYKTLIPNIIIQGYDEVCAMLDADRNVAVTYSGHILSGDVLNDLLNELHKDYMSVITRFLARQIEEDMYTRMEQAGSVIEKRVSIEKVCIDISVSEKDMLPFKLAQYVINTANNIVGYKKNLEDKEIDCNENIVVIGGPGKGKSTICQFIAQMYRANFISMRGYTNSSIDNFVQEIIANQSYDMSCCRIPFIVVLKEYAAWVRNRRNDENKSLIQYISCKIQSIEGTLIPIDELRQLIAQLPWIFMFDGLDEVPESSNRAEVLGYVRQFENFDLKEASADCFIINTTRPQGYNNEFDETHCRHLDVNELSDYECEEYIQKLFGVMEEKIEYRQNYIKIMKEALNDATTSRLMKTPLQVTIIAIIVKSGGKPPHERYSLFKQYYETIINREKQKDVIATLNDNIMWLEDIHLRIANKLQIESENEENPSAEITEDNLQKIILEYIEENRDEDYQLEEDISKKFLDIITSRICFLNENRDGYYSFSIRSMQEYFAGTYLVKGQGDKYVKENIEKIAYKSYWRNVLLFALGYIELERKYMIDEIVELCRKMNGRDNLTIDTFTDDNICLFGSWLAVDIIVEDIFKGKEKNAFIGLVGQLVGQVKHAKSNRLSMISGVSFKKLIEFVFENNNSNQKQIMQMIKFAFIMGANESNDIQEFIEKIWILADEEAKQYISLEVISSTYHYREEIVQKAAISLINQIENKKYFCILNDVAISNLLQYIDKTCSMKMKRFLLINVLDGHMNEESLMKKCIFDNRIEQVELVRLKQWWEEDVCCRNTIVESKLTEEVNINVYDYAYERKDVIFLKEYSSKIGLKFVESYCEYFLNQSYENYLNVFKLWKDEELKKVYKKLIIMNKQMPYSKDEYSVFQSGKKKIKDKLCVCNVVDILYENNEENLTYSCACAPDVYDNLINDERYKYIDITELGDAGIKIFTFVAGVQIEFGAGVFGTQSETMEKMYSVLCELIKRNLMGAHNDLLCFSIILSTYSTKFLMDNYRYSWFEKKVNQWTLANMLENREPDFLSFEDKIIILEKILQMMIDTCAESDYILLVYFLGKISKNISQKLKINSVKTLKNIQYGQKINQVTAWGLICLVDKEQNLKALIDKIFEVDLPENLIYKCMICMTLNITSENKNYILVELFKRINKSDIEEKEEYQRYILNSLLDR